MVKYFLLFLLLSFPALAQVNPVQDNLHLLSQKETQALKRHLVSLPIQVLIVSQKSTNLEEDALQLGRQYKTDMVILTNGTQFRTEISQKLEGNLPDSFTSAIIQSHLHLLPNYFEFFKQVSSQLAKESKVTQTSDPINYYWIIFLVIGFIILLFFFPDLAFIFITASLTRSDSFSSKDNTFSGGGSSNEK